MITVRFPSGFCVQYNDAHYVVWGTPRTTLLDRKDGRKIAFVPHDCLLEFEQPCRTYNASLAPADLLQEMNKALADVRRRNAMSSYDLAELKRRLMKFNGKSKAWNE